MNRWLARDRVCGRMIEVEIDDSEKILNLEACPLCGAKPLYVDLVENIGDKKIKASTAARELAESHGIDLVTIEPSGKDGSIVLDDVKAEIDRQQESEPGPGEAEGGDEGEKTGGDV